MNKIDRALRIIQARVPKTYLELSNLRVFKHSYSMFRAIARAREENYKETMKFYNSYLANDNPMKVNDYITTKYYQPLKSKRRHRQPCYTFVAFSGHPIYLTLETTSHFRVKDYVYLLLHEIGHNYASRKGKNLYDEAYADTFAIRWTKKFIEEGLIK